MDLSGGVGGRAAIILVARLAASCLLQMDESAVPEYPVTELDSDARNGRDASAIRSPAIPTPRFAWRGERQRRQNRWMSLPIRAGQDYIPRFGWVTRRPLWIETLTRDRSIGHLFADAKTGQAHAALQLSDDKFFNDKYDVLVGDG